MTDTAQGRDTAGRELLDRFRARALAHHRRHGSWWLADGHPRVLGAPDPTDASESE